MKIKTLLIILCLFMGISVSAQDVCSKYYPFKEGTTFQITNFNNKGKTESIVDYKIKNLNNNTATVSAKISDDKGKEITDTQFKVTCNGDGVSIDFNSLMNPEMFKQYKDMDIDVTGTNIEFPNNLTVGQSLSDASLNMAINMGGIKMNMSIDMVNRKVIAQESITTSAGSFNCYALNYNTEMKMGMKQSFEIKEWIAEGVGMVKSETYNKKGKTMSYSELTKIN
jgi:hypothetical protein